MNKTPLPIDYRKVGLKFIICIMVNVTAMQLAVANEIDKEAATVTHLAKGTFDVKLAPVDEPAAGIGALSISKLFHGDLEATSVGQMLAVRTPVDGSAGYVAMEVVSGKLLGRQGSFSLQHYGIMDNGAPSLTVTVVPDSGTGKLEGIRGSMSIEIKGNDHFYSFEFALPQ